MAAWGGRQNCWTSHCTSPSGSRTDVLGATQRFQFLDVRVVLMHPSVLLDVVLRLTIVLLTVAQLAPLEVPILYARAELLLHIVLPGFVPSVAIGRLPDVLHATLHDQLGMAWAWHQARHGQGPQLSAADRRGPRQKTDPTGHPAIGRRRVTGGGCRG